MAEISPTDLELSARAVVKAPIFCHITRILRSIHSLKITERIEYKLLSLTYKVLTTTQRPYLHNLISVQPPRNTRSSYLVTLARPPTSSSLRITDRSFRYASPCLWNQLPGFLRQPHSSPSLSCVFCSYFYHIFSLCQLTTLTIRNSLSALPSNTCFLRPTGVHNPNGISISSAVFRGRTTVQDRPTETYRQTDRRRYSLCNSE